MGASPSQAEISRAVRESVRRDFDRFGGERIEGSGAATTANGVHKGVAWSLGYKVLRASNGEVGLVPVITLNGEPVNKADCYTTLEKALQTVWTTARYPGDAVRITMLQRGRELGDVRIQDHGSGKFRVAAFTPGYETSFPGDTPKMNADRDIWIGYKPAANEMFDRYVSEALKDGWKVYTR